MKWRVSLGVLRVCRRKVKVRCRTQNSDVEEAIADAVTAYAAIKIHNATNAMDA